MYRPAAEVDVHDEVGELVVAMTADDSYRHDVVALLSRALMGDLDGDTPRVVVTKVTDATPPDSNELVLLLNVVRHVEGIGEQESEFSWTEWEEYTDSSPESMAAGLEVLIRTDIREELATSR